MKKPEIGTHLAHAALATLCTYGKNNQPCVSVEIVLADDPGTGDIWIGWLGDKIGRDGLTTTERTTRALRTCGWEGDDLSDIKLPADNQIEIVVDDEEWEKDNGDVVTQRKIQFINPVGGGTARPKPMAASDAKKLAEKLKLKVGGKPTTQKKSPPRDEPEFGPPGGDDDIPFDA